MESSCARAWPYSSFMPRRVMHRQCLIRWGRHIGSLAHIVYGLHAVSYHVLPSVYGWPRTVASLAASPSCPDLTQHIDVCSLRVPNMPSAVRTEWTESPGCKRYKRQEVHQCQYYLMLRCARAIREAADALQPFDGSITARHISCDLCARSQWGFFGPAIAGPCRPAAAVVPQDTTMTAPGCA